MKTCTAWDWLCCAMSHQKGEISPLQERSESNNTRQTERKKEFGVYWFIYQHHLFFEAKRTGKLSVTFLNNSPSIFVIRCWQNDFTSNVYREICGECWIFVVNRGKWVELLSWRFYFKNTVPRSPCLLRTEVTVTASTKRTSTYW